MITRESVLLTLGSIERMDREELTALLRQNVRPLLWVALIFGLLLKYFWPLLVFDLPLGVNAGIYRSLFFQYGAAWPPFVLPAMDVWAFDHPLGLFIILLPFLKLGLPVDWLLGWIWNLVPVVVAIVYGCIIGRGTVTSRQIGVFTILMTILSVGQWEMFARMEWMLTAALLFAILASTSLERRTWWTIPLGIASVATHQFIGILFLLILATWWVLHLFPLDLKSRSQLYFQVTVGGLILAGALLLYLPIAGSPLLRHAPSTLGLDTFFLYAPVLWGLGAFGFVKDIRKKKFRVWHVAVLWAAAFAVFCPMFSGDALIVFDFFLLPFSATGLLLLWRRRRFLLRSALVVLMVTQALLTTVAVTGSEPRVTQAELDALVRSTIAVPRHALILTLEPHSLPWLRGWLPAYRVSGPGGSGSPWSAVQWEAFLRGSMEERWALLQGLQGPVYFYISDAIRAVDFELANALPQEPCLEELPGTPFLRVLCAQPSGLQLERP